MTLNSSFQMSLEEYNGVAMFVVIGWAPKRYFWHNLLLIILTPFFIDGFLHIIFHKQRLTVLCELIWCLCDKNIGFFSIVHSIEVVCAFFVVNIKHFGVLILFYIKYKITDDYRIQYISKNSSPIIFSVENTMHHLLWFKKFLSTV